MNRRFKQIGRKVTYANVVSTLCLFLVLGGGAAFAASHLPKNSVGSKQIRKGAVSPAKLSPAAVHTLSGKSGPRGAQGPQGAQGAAGPAGPAGGAKGWAVVNSAGSILRSSGNILVNEISPGEYCVSSAAYSTFNAAGMAIVDWSDAESKFGDVVAVSNGNGASASNFCALGQFEVIGENTNGEESPLGFVFMIP